MNRANAISQKIAPYIEPNPYGIDLAVVGIQTSLDSLSWLVQNKNGIEISGSFGRAKTNTRNNDDEVEEVYPVCKTGNGKDNLEMIGLDSFQAYSFMYARGSATTTDDYNENQSAVYERELDVIVWVDTKRLGEDNTEYLKEQVLAKIALARFNNNADFGQVMGVEITEVIDEPSEVYEGFTVDLAKTQIIYDRYYAFRITTIVTYIAGCIR